MYWEWDLEIRKEGNEIIMKSDYGIKYTFMHNNSLMYDIGEYANAGSTIALAGNTGASTGTHSHVQIEFIK